MVIFSLYLHCLPSVYACVHVSCSYKDISHIPVDACPVTVFSLTPKNTLYPNWLLYDLSAPVAEYLRKPIQRRKDESGLMVSEVQSTVTWSHCFWACGKPEHQAEREEHAHTVANRRPWWGQAQKAYFKAKTLPLARSPFLTFLPLSKHHHLQTKPSAHEFWGIFNEQTIAVTFWDTGCSDFNTRASGTQFNLSRTFVNSQRLLQVAAKVGVVCSTCVKMRFEGQVTFHGCTS